jgi:hypothetical protein
MGRTFRRNSSRKPKQHGHTFEKKEKKEKWNKNQHAQLNERENSRSFD